MTKKKPQASDDAKEEDEDASVQEEEEEDELVEEEFRTAREVEGGKNRSTAVVYSGQCAGANQDAQIGVRRTTHRRSTHRTDVRGDDALACMYISVYRLLVRILLDRLLVSMYVSVYRLSSTRSRCYLTGTSCKHRKRWDVIRTVHL